MTRASDTAKILSGGAVFNEDSADVDFRVESNGNANMLFVDGGNDRVGIGATPSSGNGLQITNTDGASGLVLHRDFSGSNVSSDTSSNRIEFTLSDSATSNQSIALISPMASVGTGDAFAGKLRFFTATDDGAIQERMRIAQGFVKHGNIGSYRGATSTFHEFRSSIDNVNLVIDSTNASLSSDIVNFIALRASNAGNWVFLSCFSSNGSDREFRIDGDGTTHADGSYSSSGGDYAEMFEWKDGNTSNEDRVGKTVVLEGNQIRLSTSDDAQSSIIGVVSARPIVLGDAHSERWSEKFEKDVYGRYVFEEYTQTEWTEEDENGEKTLKSFQTDQIPNDETVPSDAIVTSTEDDGKTPLMRRKLNTDFDPSQTYIPREKRKEFSAIGLVGKLRVNADQAVGDRWIKMREISDTIHEYLVR